MKNIPGFLLEVVSKPHSGFGSRRSKYFNHTVGVAPTQKSGMKGVLKPLLKRTVFLFILMSIPFHALADKPKKVLPIKININMDWNHRGSGNTRTIGTYSVKVSGKARLTKKKGEYLKYEPIGMKATGKFKQRTIQEAEHFDCTGQVIMRTEGSGTIPIPAGKFIITGNLGHLGKIAAMQHTGNISLDGILNQDESQNSDNYSSMLAAGFKITQRGGCGYEGHVKEGMIPIGLNIFKELSPQGMKGSYVWKSKDGLPSYSINIIDFKGTKRFGPMKGQGARYRVNWDFDSPQPILQIWRKGKNITDGTEDVEPGEKIELECKVVPKFEGKPEKIEWLVDEDRAGAKRYIKKFDASIKKGEVLHLNKDDLNKSRVTFYWVEAGNGKVKCKATVKGEEIEAETEFGIRKPNFRVHVKASEDSTLGTMKRGGKLSPEECWISEAYKGDKTLYGLQYNGIEFECESDESGEFQWVQLIKDKVYYDNMVRQDWTWSIEGLDHCYPYESGKKAKDQPGMEASANTGSEREDNIFRTTKTQRCRMYLMYRPNCKGNEWVTLSLITWTWQGSIKYNEYKEKWEIDKDKSIPGKWTKSETSEYPEWEKNTGNKKEWKCSIPGKKRPWQE